MQRRPRVWVVAGSSLFYCAGTEQRAPPGGVPVPARTGLGNPALGEKVDVDEAKTLRVTPPPLEIVHERPREITLERYAGRDGRVAGPEVLVEIGDPVRVVHAVVGDLVIEGRAVLRHVQRHGRIFGGDPGDDLVQA